MTTYDTNREELEILQSSYKEAKNRIEDRLVEIDRALKHGTIGPRKTIQKRKLSAAARERIAAAQRARWAKVRKAEAKKLKTAKRLKTMAAGG